MMVDGTNRPTSIVLMVFRDTPIESASSAWLSRCSARKTRIRFPSLSLITVARSSQEQEGEAEQQQHQRKNGLNDDFQRHFGKRFEQQTVHRLQDDQHQETQH